MLKIWLVDIGPRNGGNMIPDLLGMIFDVDIVEMAIKIAAGETIDVNMTVNKKFYATHNIHSKKNGRYKNIEFSKQLNQYIVKKCNVPIAIYR